MADERLSTIALNTVPGLRAAAHHAALARFGSAAAALAAPPAAFAGLRGFGPETAAAVRALDGERAGEAEERRARSIGVALLTLADPGYPRRLRLIPDPPPVLYLLGDLEPGDDDAIGIVGARAATAYGRAVTARLAADLAAAGVCVVSGLARGIDGAAHRAALDAGGRTLAVLGSGLDRIYPPEHRPLALDVARRGALLSELPLGSAPDRWHFPLRNRLISGLARGIVVVEAGERSGALLTADAALEQDREVFAVPGPVTSPTSVGPNRLIKQGARLVESARDILEEFADLAGRLPAAAPSAAAPAPAVSAAERLLLEGIGPEPRPVDEIIRSASSPAADAAALLTALELKGLVTRHPGPRFARSFAVAPPAGGEQSADA